jgi:hypothetical protein
VLLYLYLPWLTAKVSPQVNEKGEGGYPLISPSFINKTNVTALYQYYFDGIFPDVDVVLDAGGRAPGGSQVKSGGAFAGGSSYWVDVITNGPDYPIRHHAHFHYPADTIIEFTGDDDVWKIVFSA